MIGSSRQSHRFLRRPNQDFVNYTTVFQLFKESLLNSASVISGRMKNAVNIALPFGKAD